MKIQIQRIEPTTPAPGHADRWVPTDPDAPMWTIEELGPADPAARRTRGDWRLWSAIAVAGGIAVLGFVGPAAPGDGGLSPSRRTSEPPSPSVTTSITAASATPFAPLSLTSPVDDAIVDGAVVEVDGVAARALGTIELAVVLDDAVLGWITVDASRGGPIHGSIPVFAPPFMVRAELVIAVLGADGAPLGTPALEKSALVRRRVSLQPGGPIGLWPATVEVDGGRQVVTVSGCAPVSVGRLQVRLVTNDGRLVATSTAVVARDATHPGFIGGYALGLGSFEAQLRPAGTTPAGPLRVEVDWSDAIGGVWGMSVMTIVVAGRPSPAASASRVP
jgi:hypothetical protein